MIPRHIIWGGMLNANEVSTYTFSITDYIVLGVFFIGKQLLTVFLWKYKNTLLFFLHSLRSHRHKSTDNV